MRSVLCLEQSGQFPLGLFFQVLIFGHQAGKLFKHQATSYRGCHQVVHFASIRTTVNVVAAGCAAGFPTLLFPTC